MKRTARWIALLYPASWRERYGNEMDALLEDIEARPGDTLDLLRGALLMRISRAGFKNAACICAAMGALVAVGIAIRTPREYLSSAVVSVGAPGGAPEPAALEGLQRAQLHTLSRGSLAELIMKYDLYQAERRRYPLEDIVNDMRNRDVRIAPLDAAHKTITVQFRYPDAQRAQAATQDLVQKLIGDMAPGMDIIDPPTLGVQPVWSRRIGIVLAGLAIGFGIGLLFMGIRRWPLIAVTAAGCALLTAGISYYVAPDQYVSSAVVRFDSAANAETILKEVLSDESIEAMMRKPLDLPQTAARLRNEGIRISDAAPSQTSRTVQVEFMYPDRYKAQMGLRELISAMIGTNLQARRNASGVEVIDPASFPELPIAPRRIAIACVGCGLGIAIGSLANRRRKPQQTTAA